MSEVIFEDFYEVPGLSLSDDVAVVPFTFDPSIAPGFAAPVGSLGLRNNAQTYRKEGVGDTSWVLFGAGGGSGGSINILLADGISTCSVPISLGAVQVLLADGVSTCDIPVI